MQPKRTRAVANLKQVAISTVLGGRTIPAHDETFDLAESIGAQLDAFREYVAGARSPEQADEAVRELLETLLAEHNA